MRFAKFPTPVLGNNTQTLYSKLYGDAGKMYIDILNSSPDEIAVISRLIAFLSEKKEALKYGYAEDSKRDRLV